MNHAYSFFLLSICLHALLISQQSAPFPEPPKDIWLRATLTGTTEPGEAMVVKGIVFHSDGKTPFPGLILYAYQTDASGFYNKTNRSWQEPRLRGWLKSDGACNYAIRTIKPGAYPGGMIPAHIHITVRYPNGRTKWLEDFHFEGDRFLSQEEISKSAARGTFSNIVILNPQPHGPLFGRRDIVVPEP